MPFYLRYAMSTGSGRREAQTAVEAAELYAELRLAGADVIDVTDGSGMKYHLAELVTNPMELAEIEYLTVTIRLLEERLRADDEGSIARSGDDLGLLSLDLERARAQLARVMDHYQKPRC